MTTETTKQTIRSAAESIEALRRSLTGELVTPDDEAYESARQLHDFRWDRRPAAIVRVANSDDVAEAVRFARRNNLALAVRSGGHSLAGHSSVDGALVVDLSEMRGVIIDPEKQTTIVQAGATTADLMGPAHAYGLALSTGDTSTVGIGGLTLGGGIGWMVRKHGLAIDNLLSARLVTADGRLIRASADEHADLFWALRGGGGNFGIVTEFEFRLAEVGAVLGGAIVLPATREVIRGYLDYVPNAPEGLTTIAQIMLAPPAPFIPEEAVGKPSFVIFISFTGDVAEGEAAIAPLRALATPIADVVGQMPYPALYQLTEVPAMRHGAFVRSMYTHDVPDGVIDAALEQMGQSVGGIDMVQFRGLGGAMGRVPQDATAFAHRNQPLFVAVIGAWLDPSEDPEPHRLWTEQIWRELEPLADGVYVNFLTEGEASRIGEAYPPATLRRLREVKRQYDPENVFRLNQNIKPAD